MYLHNNSKFQCGLRTRKEILTIAPGEAIHVFDSDVISLNSKLTQISESDFNKLNKKGTKEKVKEEKIEKEVKDPVVKEPVVEVKQVVEEKPVVEELVEVKDETIENKEENSELTELEQKLEELKAKWEVTTKASRKAQIQKQIKTIQTEIAKIKG